MEFYETMDQVIALLRRRQRASYGAIKRQFRLDDSALEDLKEAIWFAHPQVMDEAGQGLVCRDELPEPPLEALPAEMAKSMRWRLVLPAITALLQRDIRVTYQELRLIFGLDDAGLQEITRELSFKQLARDDQGEGLVWGDALEAMPERTRLDQAAERRQLTVMFCDLVGSTELSIRLDPEDLREVVRAYQENAAEVIAQFDGHIAQYLGDGLLVYFGFPQAHENDAQRAVHTGLSLIESMEGLNRRLEADKDIQLAIRLGVHTGSVVVGEMGSGERQERLALGETPNIAARLEGLAEPNTMVLSAVTARLVQRDFILEELGAHELKGVVEPMAISRVIGLQEIDYETDGPEMAGFTDLVGRDEEIGLLLRRWDQSKDGLGQVVLLSGEAGIGKSSLVGGLRRHVREEGYTRMTFRCSPYTTNSSLYPIIVHVQRALGWQIRDAAETKLEKLELALQGVDLRLEEAVPLLAALLDLPLPEGRYPVLALNPQKQRQQTQDILVAWLLEEAERQPILAVWEDLHWADPSTLEMLGLMVDQPPTASMLHLLTYRPEFEPPWPTRSHMTPLTLNRLERLQVETMITHLAGGKSLPEEVVQYIVAKTDGVPLFAEELTRMLLDATLLQEEADCYILTEPLVSMAVPDTLQDSLMARIDQLGTAKELVQLSAVLGREFSYEMLQTLVVGNDMTLQAGLQQLVEAELLYQRGRPPRARYTFKHALIQDAAYGSLLRSTRQRYHKQIAQMLETQFPDIAQVQPELAAHHYTEAACIEPALVYWQRAGQRASERSANAEAISHFSQALDLVQTLPETQALLQQELRLQTALGGAFLMVKGHTAAEVETAYTRARILCHKLGDTADVFPVLFGLWRFYVGRPNLAMTQELGEELLGLAQRVDEPQFHVVAHYTVGFTSYCQGNFLQARTHLETGATHYTPTLRNTAMFWAGQDPGVACLAYSAATLWLLGYSDRALTRGHEALSLSDELEHPFSQAYALIFSTLMWQFRREGEIVYERAAVARAVSTEQGFSYWLILSTFMHGWALMVQGEQEEGILQMGQALADWRAGGSDVLVPYFIALLAEGYGASGQINLGLDMLTEASDLIEKTGERWWEAEVVRLQGELKLMQSADHSVEAEARFYQALEIARCQQSKSLELRAAISLCRQWREQGKQNEAHDLLRPVYEWFTEGFDTSDLLDAKALLTELA